MRDKLCPKFSGGKKYKTVVVANSTVQPSMRAQMFGASWNTQDRQAVGPAPRPNYSCQVCPRSNVAQSSGTQTTEVESSRTKPARRSQVKSDEEGSSEEDDEDERTRSKKKSRKATTEDYFFSKRSPFKCMPSARSTELPFEEGFRLGYMARSKDMSGMASKLSFSCSPRISQSYSSYKRPIDIPLTCSTNTFQSCQQRKPSCILPSRVDDCPAFLRTYSCTNTQNKCPAVSQIQCPAMSQPQCPSFKDMCCKVSSCSPPKVPDLQDECPGPCTNTIRMPSKLQECPAFHQSTRNAHMGSKNFTSCPSQSTTISDCPAMVHPVCPAFSTNNTSPQIVQCNQLQTDEFAKSPEQRCFIQGSYTHNITTLASQSAITSDCPAMAHPACPSFSAKTSRPQVIPCNQIQAPKFSEPPQYKSSNITKQYEMQDCPAFEHLKQQQMSDESFARNTNNVCKFDANPYPSDQKFSTKKPERVCKEQVVNVYCHGCAENQHPPYYKSPTEDVATRNYQNQESFIKEQRQSTFPCTQENRTTRITQQQKGSSSNYLQTDSRENSPDHSAAMLMNNMYESQDIAELQAAKYDITPEMMRLSEDKCVGSSDSPKEKDSFSSLSLNHELCSASTNGRPCKYCEIMSNVMKIVQKYETKDKVNDKRPKVCTNSRVPSDLDKEKICSLFNQMAKKNKRDSA